MPWVEVDRAPTLGAHVRGQRPVSSGLVGVDDRQLDGVVVAGLVAVLRDLGQHAALDLGRRVHLPLDVERRVAVVAREEHEVDPVLRPLHVDRLDGVGAVRRVLEQAQDRLGVAGGQLVHVMVVGHGTNFTRMVRQPRAGDRRGPSMVPRAR